MNRTIFLIIFLLSQGVLLSQSLNDWINTDRFYFKTGVSADGIYRISLSDLNYAGVPVSAFNAENLQLFFKGNEIPIKVVKSQGVISYLEFYGERNTGWFDVDMYSSPEDQVNPYFSQITDTSAYFITWNSDYNNKRYTATDFNPDGQAVSHASATQLLQYTNAFYTGSEFPEYSSNKGWFDSQRITLGNTRTKSLPLPNIFDNNTTVQLDVAVVSIGDASAIGASHHLQVEAPSGDIFDTTFSGRKAVYHTFQINTSQLTENNVVQFRSIDDLGVSADNMVVSYMRVSYPSQLAVADDRHRTYVIGKSTSNRVFTLEGAIESEQPFIMDTANHLLPTPFWNGEKWQFSLPPSANDHFIVVAKNTLSADYIRQTPVSFSGYDGGDFVIIAYPQLTTSANAYANYRNAQVVTTDILYNHFSYGLEKHPLAIRNFLKDAYANTGTLPKYVLLLGKSVDISSSRNSVLYHNRNYVPTMGTPPSDNLLVTKVTNTSSYQAEVSVGRLAAQTNEQVNDYLAKVRDFELQPAAAWMKNVLHFGGGTNVNEQTTFEAYLENYEQHIEDTLMGARVSTFLKNSSDPVQITTSDSIRNLINTGSTLMTFFGHGYSGGFDQNIDEPNVYTNENRYPLLLANSCYSGNIHTTSTSSASEKWVLIPDKGAIGFLASVSEGYSSLLNTFSGYFYRNLAWYKYGEPLGEIVKQTNNQHISASSTSLSIGTALNFTLHGDPMVVLNQFELPDIVLDNQQAQVLPREVSTAIDSFAVKFVVTNIGRTINQPISYSVVHSLPDGSDSTHILTRERLFFSDTVTVWLPVDRQRGVGLNQVRIVGDYSDTYDEISENNNTLELAVNVKSTSLFPIYPYPYAAYSHDTIVLKASTGDPFIGEVFGRFEIDTASTMDSPFKRIHEQTYQGGVVQWNTGIIAEEGQTYYWRSGTRDESGDMQWQKNSFTALAEGDGWVQNTHSQLLDNELQFLTPQNNSFIFQDVPRELLCHNIGSPAGQWSNIYYSIAGQITDAACGTSAAMVVVVIDSTTFSPWFANHGDYGQINYPHCFSWSYPHALFVF
ncbi:MAG: C25 family cysteine peptidase, partial [Salinivirgaceae bacterium]